MTTSQPDPPLATRLRNACEKVEELQSENAKLRKSLEDVRQHVTVIGGSASRLSAVVAIVNEALGDE